MHEQDHRERTGSGGRAQLADERELPDWKVIFLDPGRLRLPGARRVKR